MRTHTTRAALAWHLSCVTDERNTRCAPHEPNTTALNNPGIEALGACGASVVSERGIMTKRCSPIAFAMGALLTTVGYAGTARADEVVVAHSDRGAVTGPNRVMLHSGIWTLGLSYVPALVVAISSDQTVRAYASPSISAQPRRTDPDQERRVITRSASNSSHRVNVTPKSLSTGGRISCRDSRPS